MDLVFFLDPRVRVFLSKSVRTFFEEVSQKWWERKFLGSIRMTDEWTIG